MTCVCKGDIKCKYHYLKNLHKDWTWSVDSIELYKKNQVIQDTSKIETVLKDIQETKDEIEKTKYELKAVEILDSFNKVSWFKKFKRLFHW